MCGAARFIRIAVRPYVFGVLSVSHFSSYSFFAPGGGGGWADGSGGGGVEWTGSGGGGVGRDKWMKTSASPTHPKPPHDIGLDAPMLYSKAHVKIL